MATTQDDDLPQQARRALDAIQRDRRIDLQDGAIRLRPEGGALCLEGEVTNIPSKRIALALAQQAVGDTPVHDALRLKPSEVRDDREVCEALARALTFQRELHNCTVRRRDEGGDGASQLLQEAHDDWPSGEIELAVHDGEITLTGCVISLSHKRMIEALAWRTPGCRSVVDRIRVEPAEDDNDDELADAIRLVLEMDPFVRADQVGIRSDRGVVTLGGVLPGDDERQRAELDAWSVWGVVDVHNRIEVRAGV